MKNSIRSKLFVAFGTMIVLILIVGSLGYWTMNKTDTRYTQLLEEDVALIEQLDLIRIEQAQLMSNIRGYMVYLDPLYVEALQANEKTLMEHFDVLEKNVKDKETQTLLETAKQQAQTYNDSLTPLLAYIDASDAENVQKLGASMAKDSRELLDVLQEMDNRINDQLKQDMALLHKSISKTSTSIIVSSLLAIVIGIAIAYVISKSIALPIQRLTVHIEKMAEGNFQLEPLPIRSADEIGTMSQSFNTMLERLSTLIRRVSDSSSQLAAQSEELSASSEESLASSEIVARAAEKNKESSATQSEYVAQSVESLGEVSHGIQHISESNEEMLQSAVEMGHSIEDGRTVIRDVSEQMNDIAETIQQSTSMMEDMAGKSAEIQEVSSLITNISEQTNLLALNAAIEAARAGEHGAGFAVVANEVRQLAEESHQSATKIEDMIADVYQASQQAVSSIRVGEQKVEEGLTRSDASLEVFGKIESSVTEVTDRIERISAAIEQIQAMSENVMMSSESLRDLASEGASRAQETNAATKEQLAAMHEITMSSESLAKLAEQLQEEIHHFRV